VKKRALPRYYEKRIQKIIYAGLPRSNAVVGDFLPEATYHLKIDASKKHKRDKDGCHSPDRGRTTKQHCLQESKQV